MQKFIKRIFDRFFAIICFVVSLPIVLVTMLIIHIKSPEDPTLFKQVRVGYEGREFTIYKLRTMTNERDENGELLPDEQRLKTWGKIIRKFSIDEFTQVWNILLGQMSFIGPRPLLPKEMQVMTLEEQKCRQSMYPGITGWEAVNEENSGTREEMAQYDLYYVRNWSLAFDVKIFFITVWILLRGHRADDELRAPKIMDEEVKTEQVYFAEDKE